MKLKKLLPLWEVMTCLLLSGRCFADTEPSPAAGDTDIVRDVTFVTKGWRAPAAGYWLTEASGRDVLSGWRADHEAARIYKEALSDAQKRVAAADARIAELTRRAKAQARRWPVGLGIFGGVGQHGDGVIGAGLVILLK